MKGEQTTTCHTQGPDQSATYLLALYVNLSEEKEALGMWISQIESAKFRLQAVTELKNHSVLDSALAWGARGWSSIEAKLAD